jgi:ADP-ribose pyrophosphatase
MNKILKKWELIRKKEIFKSKWLSLYNNTYKLPDGNIGEDYFHLDRPNYVLIIAIDEKNRLIVEKNYRRGVDDFVYELPAGWIDDGEDANQAAKRELQEETGYIVENVEILGHVYPQPAFSSMEADVVLVKIKNKNKGNQDLGHDENIDFELIDLEKVRGMIKKGKIKDMGFLSAVGLFANKK